MPTPQHGYKLTLLAAALAVAGCATSFSPTPKAVPAAETTAIPALAPSVTATVRPDLAIDRWWTLFGDASLDRLIDEALARNEDLEAAVARVREARANFDSARAAHSPTLDARAESGRGQQSTVAAMPLPPGLDRRASSHTASLVAGYELDLWGRLSAGSDAARHQLLATEWARASVEWSLTSRLAETYFDLAAVDRQIEITTAMRDAWQSTFELRRQEHAGGAGSEFDVRRAEAELTGTEATLSSFLRQRAALERNLTLLLGRSPAEITAGAPLRNRLDESRALQAVLPQGSSAELLVRRPDIRQAEAELAAANSSIEAARAATLPSLRLSGAIGSDAKAVSDLFSGPAFIWSIAASATQPLIDGGRLKAQVRAEQARAEQTLADYRKTVVAAVLEVREAYEVLDITHETFRAEHARVAALGRARDLAKLGYDNGAYGYLDLLDAERNLHQAQINQVTAYRDRLVGQVAAFRALGGGHAGAASTPQIAANNH